MKTNAPTKLDTTKPVPQLIREAVEEISQCNLAIAEARANFEQIRQEKQALMTAAIGRLSVLTMER